MAKHNQKAWIRTLMAAATLLAVIAPDFGSGSDRLRGSTGAERHSPAADPQVSVPDRAESLLRFGSASRSLAERPQPEPPGSLAMDNRQLDTLLQAGFIEVLHPEGGLLRIELLRLEEIDTLRILHVVSEGLRGVITERQGSYFATIATPAGVYTLERHDGRTRLSDQQQLDLRSNPDQRDYRHAPLA